MITVYSDVFIPIPPECMAVLMGYMFILHDFVPVN